MGAGCIVVLMLVVGWYRGNNETSQLIEACQQDVLETWAEDESVADIEFHNTTVVDYGEDTVVLGVMTGGGPPHLQMTEPPEGPFAQTFECRVSDNGEAEFASSSYIF